MDVLTTSCGNVVEVMEGGTVKITGQFTNSDNEVLDKDSLASLTASLQYGNQYINGRQDQTILDANGGTVSTDGELTLYLGSSDNINLESDTDKLEPHVLTIKWQWVDESSVTRDDLAQYIIYVQPVTDKSDPQSPAVNDGDRKTVIKGDTYDIAFGVVPKWYWPENFPGYVYGCTATLGAEDSSGNTITQPLGIDADVSPVMVYAEFTAVETGALSVGRYRYDVQIEFPTGEKKTLASGMMSVINTYTA